MLKWSNLKKDNSNKNKKYFNLQNYNFFYFKLEEKNNPKKYLLSFDIEKFKIIELICLKNGVKKVISSNITTSTINTIKKQIVRKHLEKNNYIWGYCNLNKEKKFYFRENKNQIFKDLNIKEIDNIKMYIGDKLLNYLINYKVKIKNNIEVRYYEIKNNFKYNNNRLKCVVEKRKQHYIQKSIIKNFENNKYQFLNFKTNEKKSFINKKNFEKEFQDEYLYDLNYDAWITGKEERYSLEKQDISDIENSFNEIYKKIKNKDYINNIDNKNLIYYLMFQLYRIPRTKNTFIEYFKDEILNFYYSRDIIKKILRMKIKKINSNIIENIINHMEIYYFSTKIKEYHKNLIKMILIKNFKNTYNSNPLINIIKILLDNKNTNLIYSFDNLKIKILTNIKSENNISTLTPITELIEDKFFYYIIPLDPKNSILFYKKTERKKVFKKLNINRKKTKKYIKISKKSINEINSLNEDILKKMKIDIKKIIKINN